MSYYFQALASAISVDLVTVDRAEKPYTCQYCPVASLRKDVIIRHTRKFHQEEASSHTRNEVISNTFSASDAFDPALTIESHQNLLDPDSTQIPFPQESLFSFSKTQDTDRSSFNSPLDLGHLPGHPAGLQSDFHNSILDSFPLRQFSDPRFMDLHDSSISLPQFRETLFEISMNGLEDFPSSQFDSSSLGSSFEDDNKESEKSERLLLVGDEEYSEAQENLSQSVSAHVLQGFQLPSKYAVIRFVKAFFNHMAPHLPVIHRPSFSFGTMPCEFTNTKPQSRY